MALHPSTGCCVLRSSSRPPWGLYWDVPHPPASALLLARTYVVTSPAVIYHPHTAMLWVHLSGLHKPVQLTVQLQRPDGTHNITLLERKVQEPHLYLNITFPVSVTLCTAVSVEGDAPDTPLSPGRAVSTSSPERGALVPTLLCSPKPLQLEEDGTRCDFPIFW